jgi:hypothetical protein
MSFSEKEEGDSNGASARVLAAITSARHGGDGLDYSKRGLNGCGME